MSSWCSRHILSINVNEIDYDISIDPYSVNYIFHIPILYYKIQSVCVIVCLYVYVE